MNMEPKRKLSIGKGAVLAAVILSTAVMSFGQKRRQAAEPVDERLVREKLGSMDRAAILHEEKLISAEYEMAKKTKYYFILHIGEKKMELKVRGMVLRTWNIDEIRFWGKPEFEGKNGSIVLARKTTLKAPARTVIKPGAEEETPSDPASFNLNTLELDDMPDSFELNFDTGLVVKMNVKKPLNFSGKVKATINEDIIAPVRRFLDSRKGKSMSELEISFADPNEPKAIYWCFVEGIEGIIK